MLEEGDLRLDRRHDVVHRVDHPTRKGADRRGDPAPVAGRHVVGVFRRQLGQMRIEADHHRAALVDDGLHQAIGKMRLFRDRLHHHLHRRRRSVPGRYTSVRARFKVYMDSVRFVDRLAVVNKT